MRFQQIVRSLALLYDARVYRPRLTTDKRELKEYAVEHGIDLIGVTSAEPFMRKKVDRLNEQLMDPRTYLENAKSVVVYGFYYGRALEVSEKAERDTGIHPSRKYEIQ
jgi:tRNA(Ile)-lysidine synthase TilS/MesJ